MMSAGIVWIGLPLVVAVLLWVLQSRRVFTLITAASVSLLLALLAWVLPIDNAIKLGPISVEVSSTATILGRSFVLNSGDSRLLALIFLLGGVFFLAGLMLRVNRFFAPLGLAMISLLVAALAVEPFLFSALLIEMAVLVSVPLLSPPGHPVGKGVLRYLIFQTLAMPFILFAGWVFGGVEINPADTQLLVQSVVLMGFGFAFWLAVFPLYTWIPLLTEEVSPLMAGFVLSLLPTVILFLMLHFFNGFPWLWQYPVLRTALRLVGVLMAATGGAWAIFERNLNRLLGYAVIIENGYALLALSLGDANGLNLFAMMFLPRLVALLLWSGGLTLLAGGGSLTFAETGALLRRKPVASVGMLIAIFSMGGLPLLAGLPARLALLQSVSEVSFSIVLWAALGSVGLLFGGGRILSYMVLGEGKWQIEEGWVQRIALSAGALILLLAGVFPGWFLPLMSPLLAAFERLR
jgi:NADH-quinone oxidoreductase subunit N